MVTSAVGIVGFGQFGRALGGLLSEAGLPISAWDPVADVPHDVRAADLPELARRADTIIVATPVPAIRDVLTALRPHVGGSHLVLDVGSVKSAPARAMEDVLGQAVPWAATHPLFGPASLALGERPLRVVVCPSPLHPSAAVRARALFERAGCQVVELGAEEHDRLMALTHALALFVAKGLHDVLGDERPIFTPPSFQAIERVVDTVRADAGHLFVTIENENPFAAEARRLLLESLARVDAGLGAAAESSRRGEVLPSLAIPDLGSRNPSLREARELIDEVDRDLLALLVRRAALARRAGRAKAVEGRPVVDSRREAEIRAERSRWASDAGLDPSAVGEIFDAVVRLSRAVQGRSEPGVGP